jgi:hypothetical protein
VFGLLVSSLTVSGVGLATQVMYNLKGREILNAPLAEDRDNLTVGAAPCEQPFRDTHIRL